MYIAREFRNSAGAQGGRSAGPQRYKSWGRYVAMIKGGWANFAKAGQKKIPKGIELGLGRKKWGPQTKGEDPLVSSEGDRGPLVGKLRLGCMYLHAFISKSCR